MKNKPVLQLIGKPVVTTIGFTDITFYKFAYVDGFGMPDLRNALIYVTIVTVGAPPTLCMDTKATPEQISVMKSLIDQYDAFGDYFGS